MMKRRFLFALSVWTGALTVASCSEGWPRDLTINDQQQQSVFVICEKAVRSPFISLEEIAAFAQFCLNWRALMEKNREQASVPEQVPVPKE